MTTVGYGDIYPKSDFGRSVAVVACILGTVQISILVAVIDGQTRFESPETNMLKLVKKYDAIKTLKHLAALRVQKAWLARYITRQNRNSRFVDPWSKLRELRAYSKLSHVIMAWRKYSRKMKYKRHYSFLEEHALENSRCERIAGFTQKLIQKDIEKLTRNTPGQRTDTLESYKEHDDENVLTTSVTHFDEQKLSELWQKVMEISEEN